MPGDVEVVEAGGVGALGDDLADGLRRQWAVNDAGGSAPDPLEEGVPRAQISGLDPFPQRTNRVSRRVLPAHPGHG